ncbi:MULTISPECIES: TetR/AcrR family transcriptional regulator [Nocardiaceae]|uniref:TetR/AcrR family transcriptional regulator n=1 Tax=Nocardiaceae TaxID=85025 RepID=UPI001E42F74D|nr:MULTISPECIES: TetR/AcrR family transcriptional regulator [Rhodococcus]MCZ4277664.1 TetR/AcrR family transcriptional regulator [Rhodococcus yunnanensis]
MAVAEPESLLTCEGARHWGGPEHALVDTETGHAQRRGGPYPDRYPYTPESLAIVFAMAKERDQPESAVDGRTVRWADHKAERRTRILDAGVAVIGEKGPDVGVETIARRAGVPRSVVYRVFKDRSDLDEQLRVRILGILLDRLAVDPMGTIGEAVADGVDSYLSWVVEFPQLHLFLGIGSASRRTEGSRTVTGAKTAVAVKVTAVFDMNLRARNADPALAETLAFGLIGLIDHSVNRWLANPERAIDEQQLAEFLKLSIWQVVDGVAKREGIEIRPSDPVIYS